MSSPNNGPEPKVADGSSASAAAPASSSGATTVTGSAAGGVVPSAGLRKKRSTLWPTLFIIALVATVGVFTFYDRMRPRERITVTFSDVHGLHVGSPVEHRGDQIGEVVEIGRPGDLGKRKVVVELIGDSNIHDRLRRKGNEFFVSRFASDHMQLKGVTKVIRGPSIVVRLGSPDGDFRKDFDGSDSMPPDSRVEWNSVRASATFRNIQGLEEGAPVLDRGQEIGIVEKIVREPGSDFLSVSMAFFTTEPGSCPYLKPGTRYFINKAKLSLKGVEGDPETLLYGAKVVVVPDPNATGGVTQSFVGEADSPPEYLPRAGEKERLLESAGYIPADTPIFYRGELAGYVLRVQQSSDSNSFRLTARFYPNAQPQVCEQSVFFLQTKVKAQLFKSKGLFNWEGPRFEIPDAQALLRPAIEFRTPPNSGKPVKFDGTEPPFTVHPEPKEEWLHWASSIPVEPQLPAGEGVKVTFPQTVFAKFEWRKSYQPLISWNKHEGFVLPVATGVIGPSEVLRPTVAESSVVKANLQIAGQVRSRTKPTYVDLGPGVCFTPVDLGDKVVRCASSQLASVRQPVDCWVVIDAEQPKAIAASKLTASGDLWNVQADSGFQPGWHGAAVLCRDRNSAAYGKVVGVFLVKKGTATVSLFPAGVENLVG